jgi:hypothetical protein
MTEEKAKYADEDAAAVLTSYLVTTHRNQLKRAFNPAPLSLPDFHVLRDTPRLPTSYIHHVSL